VTEFTPLSPIDSNQPDWNEEAEIEAALLARERTQTIATVYDHYYEEGFHKFLYRQAIPIVPETIEEEIGLAIVDTVYRHRLDTIFSTIQKGCAIYVASIVLFLLSGTQLQKALLLSCPISSVLAPIAAIAEQPKKRKLIIKDVAKIF
jgi:hypothetical protein